jgi:NAD-dependent dihydropyrimidine dehydrogenase PreA subunit
MTSLVSMQAEVSPAVQLKRTDMLGCVQYYKDAMLNRFYAICNCCTCCCGAMAHRHGTPMLASSGYVAQVDGDLCVGYGICAESRQFGTLAVSGDVAVVDDDGCMGCGVCVSRCPQGALSLLCESSRGEPLEIQRLLKAA